MDRLGDNDESLFAAERGAKNRGSGRTAFDSLRRDPPLTSAPVEKNNERPGMRALASCGPSAARKTWRRAVVSE